LPTESIVVGEIEASEAPHQHAGPGGGIVRYAMLSPLLLERLRAWWRDANTRGKRRQCPQNQTYPSRLLIYRSFSLKAFLVLSDPYQTNTWQIV